MHVTSESDCRYRVPASYAYSYCVLRVLSTVNAAIVLHVILKHANRPRCPVFLEDSHYRRLFPDLRKTPIFQHYWNSVISSANYIYNLFFTYIRFICLHVCHVHVSVISSMSNLLSSLGKYLLNRYLFVSSSPVVYVPSSFIRFVPGFFLCTSVQALYHGLSSMLYAIIQYLLQVLFFQLPYRFLVGIPL